MSAWPAPSASASLLLAPPAAASAHVALPPPVSPVAPTVVLPPPAGRSPARPHAGRHVRLARRVRSPRGSPAVSMASLATRFVALAWCWLLIWCLLWSFVPTLVGWSPTVVTSGSMEPSLAVGDVVHIDHSIDLSSLGAGSVITFDDPGLDGMRVTHRVTGVEREGDRVVGFRTKGDANEVADSSIVRIEDVHGVGRLVVPYAGLPRVWADEGRWIHLSAFALLTIVAAFLAGDTVQQYVTGRSRRPRRKQLVAIGIAIAAMLGAPSSSAAFTTTTDNPANGFTMTSQWFLDTIDRDVPAAHWRLGEVAAPPVTAFTDDFETFAGWTAFGSGGFSSSTSQAYSGVRSGYKTGRAEPTGAWKALPSTVGGSVVLDVWMYRKDKGGDAIDGAGLADASSSGYSFRVDHKNDVMRIERRTGGVATPIGTPVSFNPPEREWFRMELVRQGGSMVLNAYDGAGGLLASTTATDATTTSFDRALVFGGDGYHVDDLRIVQHFPPVLAVDRIATLDGSYAGFPAAGVPGLVTGQPDTAVDFDGLDDGVTIGDSAAINLTPRAERTTELWFAADALVGRRVLYEEGGTTDGLGIYLDGATLYAMAWSDSLGWSNDLVTSATVAPTTTYHVAVTLDAVGTRSLVLYLDGVPVDSATKTDANLWNAHPDDGAIGFLNGGTRFHDGNASGTGAFAFDGTIDEVVLFNSVVTAAHIANHHAAG